jgi:hypothetical protein
MVWERGSSRRDAAFPSAAAVVEVFFKTGGVWAVNLVVGVEVGWGKVGEGDAGRPWGRPA